MARQVFPGQRNVQRPGAPNALVRNAAGATATIYSDAAGTTLANIQDLTGVAIVGSKLTVDSNSQLPEFLGPDGVDTLYAVVDGGPLVPVYARTDDRLDALELAAGNMYGYLAMAYDPVVAATGTALTAGVLGLSRVRLPRPAVVANVILHVSTAGATLTGGQCYAGLWAADGTLLAVTASGQATNWQSVGTKVMPLGAVATRPAGDYYVGYWAVGTTMPQFASRSGAIPVNADLAAANARFATADTGLSTTAPASLGAKTAVTSSIWAALS